MSTNEQITSLPSATQANLTDIIYAVQGYVSPSVLGTSVQQTMQQVYTLMHNNLIANNPGNPNGIVAGTLYQLCWDTTNAILYICITAGNAASAVWDKSIQLTAGTGITIVQNGANIQISSSAAGISWNTITGASATLASNNGYIINHASAVTLTLPGTFNVGDIIMISGYGAGLWSIAQNAGQKIIIGNALTTIGVTGSLSATNQYDSIELIGHVANTVLKNVSGGQGILTVV